MSRERDVAQLVLRYEEDGYRYLIAKRTKDGYWEFIGGKREEGESLEEAALRELDEELENVEPGDAEIIELAEPYPSEDNPRYMLHPVLMEITAEKARELEDRHLSEEHSELEWIRLRDFDSYETLGQKEALEKLVNGEVSLAVPRRRGKLLLVKRSSDNSSTGYWVFPGGKIEDEPAREAALRELEEETALKGEVMAEGDPYITGGELGLWHIHPVLVEVEPGKVRLDDEHSDYKWLEPEKINEKKTLGGLESLERLDIA